MYWPCAAYNQTVGNHILKHAELRRLVRRLHCRVRLAPITHHTPSHKGGALRVDGLARAVGRLCADLQWRERVRRLGAASELQRAQLDGKAVAVPTGREPDAAAAQQLPPIDHVF